jgi:hypothetical protein
MCRPVLCQTCGLITWAGCGDHVDEVRAVVPAEQWCPGHEADNQDHHSGHDHQHDGGFFSRVLRR